MTIGELARKVGLRPSAIRFYETRGVLDVPPRGANEYRLYGLEAVTMLIFVREARKLGLSLQEIRQIIEQSKHGSPCALSRQLLLCHIEKIDGELARLQKLRGQLQEILRNPPPPSDSGICPMIEAAERLG